MLNTTGAIGDGVIFKAGIEYAYPSDSPFFASIDPHPLKRRWLWETDEHGRERKSLSWKAYEDLESLLAKRQAIDALVEQHSDDREKARVLVYDEQPAGPDDEGRVIDTNNPDHSFSSNASLANVLSFLKNPEDYLHFLPEFKSTQLKKYSDVWGMLGMGRIGNVIERQRSDEAISPEAARRYGDYPDSDYARASSFKRVVHGNRLEDREHMELLQIIGKLAAHNILKESKDSAG